MAHIQPIVRIELDPSRPVPEICHVIMSVMPYHPGQEEAILRGVQEAIEKRLKQLEKEADADAEQVRKSGRK